MEAAALEGEDKTLALGVSPVVEDRLQAQPVEGGKETETDQWVKEDTLVLVAQSLEELDWPS